MSVYINTVGIDKTKVYRFSMKIRNAQRVISVGAGLIVYSMHRYANIVLEQVNTGNSFTTTSLTWAALDIKIAWGISLT